MQLSAKRRFTGNDIADIDVGQWRIVAARSNTQQCDSSFAFIAQARVEHNVFIRDFHDIPDGQLFLPVTATDDSNHGPFTDEQTVRNREDWPEWRAATDAEF